jgi:hypothetical protein
MEGSYIVETSSNVDSFFKATGDSFLIDYIDKYKLHTAVEGKERCARELIRCRQVGFWEKACF